MNSSRKDRIFTIPNLLSLCRILLIPVFLAFMLNHKIFTAFIIFLIAAFTDLLDGIIARIWKQKSKLGAYLDPTGDKLLMTACFIILSFPSLSNPNTVPLLLTVIIIGRDLLIVTGAFYVLKTRGQTAFNPTLLGKTCTVSQMCVLLLVLFLNVLQISPIYLSWLYFITLFLTLLSAIHYTYIGIQMLALPKKH